jgi:hypothetical protein
LKELTRERVPLEWAAAQNNLAQALNNFGDALLKDARAAAVDPRLAPDLCNENALGNQG